MAKTILFTGSASQGIKTLTDTFSHIPLSLGLKVSSSQFYQSSPRKGAMGGDVVIGSDCQNFYVDYLVALSQEGLDHTKERVNKNTVLIYDSKEVKTDLKTKKSIGIDFKNISKSRYSNGAAMGVLFKLLGIKDKKKLNKILKAKFKGDTKEIIQGFDSLDYKVSNLLNPKKKKQIKKDLYYLMGNEAAVYGALAAGANFFAGYPITPSSETLHNWSNIYELIKQAGFVQGNSEEHAMGVLLGANVAGGKGWTSTSGPGLDRMLEQIGWAAASKTPFVIYNVQRGGPSTGLATLTQTSDLFTAIYGSHGDYPIFVLTPSTAQDTYELMKTAFSLAWKYNIGVIVNSSKETAQRRNIVKLDLKELDNANFNLEKTTKGNRTGSTAGKNDLPSNKAAVWWLDNRFEEFEKDYDNLCLAEFKNIKIKNKKIISAPEEVYICYGETVPVIKEKLSKKGLIALKSVYPYPIDIIKQLNNLNVKKIYVAENNRGVKVHEEQGQLANKVRQYFKKKVITLNKYDGFPMYPDKLEDYIQNDN